MVQTFKKACVLAAVLLVGCAPGRDFVRPDDASLKLRQTTYEQVIAMVGQPESEGMGVTNGKNVKHVSYVASGGQSADASAAAVRAMSFYFLDSTLVGYEFVSTRAQDSTNFDEAKVSQITKGKTTRAEVRQLIGKPAGYRVYPLIPDASGEADCYAYAAVTGSVFHLKRQSKLLIVTYDGRGIVSDVALKSTASL
jgi:hypothetical protein